MQKHLEITRQRLQNFASDSNLRGRLYPERAPVSLSVFSAPDRISYAEALRGAYRPTKVGEQFGPVWSTHWFKVDLEIPAGWKGREVHLLWDSSSEACVWEEGVPVQGLTGSGAPAWVGNARPLRGEYRLTRSAKGGERQTLYLEMACNHLFGATEFGAGMGYLLRQAELAVFDPEAWALLWDFVIIADLAQQLPADSPRAGQALQAANAMVNACNLEDRATWSVARAIAAEFFAARNGDRQHILSAVGHAHIDTAWLWPLAETQRKCYRTFATAVHYMEDYPEYKFACSQAQQFEWMKDQQPALYDKIKAQARAGRFVPAGGTWVEPDCNIPSGESLVRQFLFGQRFFRQEFGRTCTEFWNPDVFGYCGQLPQIMRGAGIDYFLTQKLSWNQFNKPASHTFLWEGIDGTRVLTHFPPADTYGGSGSVREVLFNVRNFKDHERANESYYLFGYSDGGGGPTREMLEQLRRMRDVEGLARVETRSPTEFFARCAADVKDPTIWVGELYFELHRGTYTTQACNKLHNRRCEILLHDVELLSVLARPGLPYPRTELDRLWKLVLMNQFHDIIPGSSIREVYVDSALQYQDIAHTGQRLLDQALTGLLTPSVATTAPTDRVLAVNTLSAPREEVVELPFECLSSQTSAEGRPLAVVGAPPLGYRIAPLQRTVSASAQLSESQGEFTLENQFVRAVFRRDGHLISLLDKRAGREAIQVGALANHFMLFDDEPLNFDAWDVDVFHLEKRYEVAGARSVRVVERGPLRVALGAEYDLSPTSRLRQTVTLTAVSPRLDFATEVQWDEHHKFLKVEFPLEIRADQATYEIQFGHLQRPTHFNTSYDLARFEVCAHRWADLSEPGFGVALLNDSKYGHATHRNVMRLSLLRSPKSPDRQADLGEHAFRYALLPHAGDFREADVIAEGYRFNYPLHLRRTHQPMEERSILAVDHPSVIIDTVKQAEDSEAIVVRLYEAHGGRRTVRLSSPLPVRAVSRCNLLEEDERPLEWVDGGVCFPVTPFQIVTLKLKLAAARA